MRKKNPLSQRQWLNIIIIATSAMFLIMVLIGRMFEGKNTNSANDSPVINQMIKIDFGDRALILQGDQWIDLSAVPLPAEKIKKIINNWQSLLLKQASPIDNERLTGQNILLYFSQQSNPIICKVSQHNNQIIFQWTQAQKQLVLENISLSDYIPLKYSF